MTSNSCLRNKVALVLYLLLLLFITSTLISASSHYHHTKSTFATRRFLLDLEDGDGNEPIIIKKQKTTSSSTSSSSSSSSKSAFSTKMNQTKLAKPSSSSSTTSSKNQTKLSKPSTTSSSKISQTKLIKNTDLSAHAPKNKTKTTKTTSSGSDSDSDHSSPTNLIKSQIKKLNSTSKKPSNSTTTKKTSSSSSSSSSDPSKLTSPKNKTTTTTTTTTTKPDQPISKPQPKKPQKTQQPKPTWLDQDDDEDDDIVAELRDLPSKFQESFMPDLERISKTSKVYLNKYNKEFTKGFKPYVGNRYASTIASLVSLAFVVVPLVLVSLIFHRIKAYFSLQKLLIFIQVYLAIYFTILCMSSLATGLEPLRFFYSASRSTYACVQVLQTLAYVLYLLLLLMYLILVFSTETGPATKMLGLGQTFVGFAVGLHYYVTVFHRAVLHQPPKTNWKVHALYATCFVVISLLGRLDRRKKAYLEYGGEEGKKS